MFNISILLFNYVHASDDIKLCEKSKPLVVYTDTTMNGSFEIIGSNIFAAIEHHISKIKTKAAVLKESVAPKVHSFFNRAQRNGLYSILTLYICFRNICLHTKFFFTYQFLCIYAFVIYVYFNPSQGTMKLH